MPYKVFVKNRTPSSVHALPQRPEGEVEYIILYFLLFVHLKKKQN